MISVSVAVSWMKKLLSHNNKLYFTYLFQELLSFNNNGLIKSITLNNGAYPTKRKIRFTSSQLLI